jgi:transposase InsO family protein
MWANREEFELKRMCRVLRVSRSGHYDWARREESKRSQEDRALLKEIRKIHQETKEGLRCHQDVAGFETIWDGVRQAARLCRQAAIEARRSRKFRLAYKARNTAPAAPNLLRWPFKADYPDQVWVTDVTFTPTRSGWLYLAVMIDLHTRLVSVGQ